jgi:type VI protein secretion system component VasK
MEMRLIIAYSIMLFMALAFAGILFYATRRGRARRRNERFHSRRRKARTEAQASA